MVWFFRRRRERVQMDTFYDNDACEFVMRLHYPDGRSHVERFDTLSDFREGLKQAEQRLLAEHWGQDGSPIVIPDGFPNRRLN
jgi:hypothetical protein